MVKSNSAPLLPGLKTAYKSSQIIKLNDISFVEKKPEVKVENKDSKDKEEDKKPVKRPSTDGEPKLKIKSPAQLKGILLDSLEKESLDMKDSEIKIKREKKENIKGDKQKGCSSNSSKGNSKLKEGK